MFKRALREQVKLRLGICGPAGSGKTMSAIKLARGLVGPSGKIAMLDTERGSGSLYSHLTEYDVCPLFPPFSPKRYIEVIHGAEKSGYDVLVIDSLSHAWSAEGGVLDMHDEAEQAMKSKNSYTAWRSVTPEHNRLVDAMLQSPIHIIGTMRTKTAYELVDDHGKKVPRKIGLAPIQREGMDFEFTVVFDTDAQHYATSSKDRTDTFKVDDWRQVITEDTGLLIKTWLESGADPGQNMTAEERDYITGREQLEACATIEALSATWLAFTSSQRGLLGDIKDMLKKQLLESQGGQAE